MKRPYELDTNNHAVFKLTYHLIITTKYRRKVITHDIGTLLERTFRRLQARYGIELQELGYEQDHAHYLFTAKPNSEISKFINVYKSSTSRQAQNMFPSIKEKLWNGQLWTGSYFLVTTGGAPMEVIREYIENQGYMKEGR